ncbi:predicted protein [Histoplasma capsulatum G186AR]|uniref:Uncharacterized protein n=2 Tax=Ajellomyces capsulatus TaxID=5037 RepID=C0NNE7_AJECG|nr:uncharacterized protein HCBG_04274 [Histoplasma capsulatum G186AR]EEH07395.1 predicted protein [Histoplasma capsulatum G186AR]KAG5304470.1 hypothetical protein I7I52_02808 [Histoplasma capsulatum]QSS70068.1 hypothetical protein I7I50_11571 [Histoplasma capsulatum G186AR]
MATLNQINILKLSDLPKRAVLNQDADENGCVFLPWNLSEDGKSYLPPSAIVALALNEVGRALGMGTFTYIPASVPFMPLCIPEVFFTSRKWTEQDKRNWDDASHPQKLQIVSEVRSQELAIPIRVLVYGYPQEYMSFAKERARLSGAIITYDSRPFVGWYREYASRRNGDKGHVSIDLLQHEAWFNSMHCEDNFALVQRLLQMWNEPVYYGVQVIGYVLKKLDDLKKRQKDAESKTSCKGGAEIPKLKTAGLDLRSLARFALEECDAEYLEE